MTVGLRGLLLAAFYLILVGQLSLDEGALALACAGIVLAWWVLLDRVVQQRFRFSRRAIVILGRAVADIPRGVVAVAPAFLWRRRGRWQRQAQASGDRDSDLCCRAARLLAISLAPDRYAVRWTSRPDGIETHNLSLKPATKEPAG